MSHWNNNDREESKPSWLTPAQKINCVRTSKGWEVPLNGTNVGGSPDGLKNLTGPSLTSQTFNTELLVCMPNDVVYDPNIVVALTGPMTMFHFGSSATGFSLTGNTIYYYNPEANYAGGSTSGVAAIGVIVAATAAAGAYNVQLKGFQNPPRPVLSGPRDINSTGIMHPAGVTSATASVSSVVQIIDNVFSTSSLYTSRIAVTGGLGVTHDLPNYAPYITCPFSGDSATAGGLEGRGVSFGTSLTGSGGAQGYYGVGAFGNSTLNFPGATAYIKIVANDSNFTNNISFSIVSSTPAFGNTTLLVTGSSLLTSTNVPTGVYETFFGPTASINNNIAVLRINKPGATANTTRTVVVRANDGTVDADSTFTISFGATA